MSEREHRAATARVLRADDDRGSGAFYPPVGATDTDDLEKRDGKPLHYKVICISMYTSDLDRLDGMVDELKAMGITKANRSALIRHALTQVDLQKVPRGM